MSGAAQVDRLKRWMNIGFEPHSVAPNARLAQPLSKVEDADSEYILFNYFGFNTAYCSQPPF